MKVLMFYHSLLSDWNHGNAHFLRGIASELISRKDEVKIFEPSDSWSMKNLLKQQKNGQEVINDFYNFYPLLDSIKYDKDELDLDNILDQADLVIVHEWNDPDIIKKIGNHRKLNTGYKLLFHDTHHRSFTDINSISKLDLSGYDGVLAYGSVIRDIYLSKGWSQRAWTWHEAADIRVFHPIKDKAKEGDLVWIGNWGDEERTKELYEFLINPVIELKIKTRIYGVRYPDNTLKEIEGLGIEYGSYLPNFRVPLAFAHFKLTLHIPRKPYVKSLPGIPTIRPFEALACGIPLICSPWEDTENLFRPGMDLLIASDGNKMKMMIRDVLNDNELAEFLSRHGLETILNHHTCAHRVDQLMRICKDLGVHENKDLIRE